MPSRVPALMVQATNSDAGKSLLVTGLCRAFSRRGLRVRPFKPQNMSNNAAVAEGGEIGRAQALQARACGVPPSVHMNPILLKPEGEGRSQLVVRGRARGSVTAAEYYRMKAELLPCALDSFARLAAESDLLLVEGAGSASEINLRDADLANMGFARAADLPVLLVGDIDRGGVIASLVGTVAVLEPAERARLRGFLINKLRGDPALFTPVLPLLEARTGLSCLGIVPWFDAAHLLPAEDSLGLDSRANRRAGASVRIAVPRLPRLANFDDLDPLSQEPAVEMRLTALEEPLATDTDIVLLPGSKTTIGDLLALRESGFEADIRAHHRRGGWVVGLCGGFQMLGRSVADPEGLEGEPRRVPGLALLDVETVLERGKTVRLARGLELTTGEAVTGYEIHLGRTTGPGTERPWLRLETGPDGAVSADGRVLGCYLHGLFASDGFRRRFLERFTSGGLPALAYEARVERTLDALADHLETALDLDRILGVALTRTEAART